MSEGQGRFAAAVLDPELPVPTELSDSAQHRFSVYRNNVVAGLASALEAAFPVVLKLLGDEFFRAMACVYLRGYPPDSPVLMRFGRHMPEFLAEFPPLRHLPYLEDVARLELAIRAAYHAGDAGTVASDTLQGLDAAAIATARVRLAPSVFLLRSPYPVCRIWLANMRGGPFPQSGGDDVMIVRREFDPEPIRLESGEFEFLTALQGGNSIAEANDAGGAVIPEFRLDVIIQRLLGFNAITDLRISADSGQHRDRIPGQ
ncbi:MAG: DNA-binding domain-containing protein [Rhodobacteraceae bacterium]|nr:DNA-binding domain-containing protein [Paracoccaceae bacterium]